MTTFIEYKHVYRRFGPESIESALYDFICGIQQRISEKLQIEKTDKLTEIAVCFDLAGSIFEDPVKDGVRRKRYYENDSMILIAVGIPIEKVVLPKEEFSELMKPLLQKIGNSVVAVIEKHGLEIDTTKIFQTFSEAVD